MSPTRHPREGGDPEARRPLLEPKVRRDWIRAFAGMKKVGVVASTALLAACATQVPSAVQHAATTPGFLLGLWHGFIFPVAWVLSLFLPEVAVYAVPNDGGWYDFGYFLGIVVFGVGARRSHTIVRTRVVRG